MREIVGLHRQTFWEEITPIWLLGFLFHNLWCLGEALSHCKSVIPYKLFICACIYFRKLLQVLDFYSFSRFFNIILLQFYTPFTLLTHSLPHLILLALLASIPASSPPVSYLLSFENPFYPWLLTSSLSSVGSMSQDSKLLSTWENMWQFSFWVWVSFTQWLFLASFIWEFHFS